MRPLLRVQAVCAICILFSACATSPTIAPQVNSLVIAEKYSYALQLLTTTKDAYGRKNELLYLLDYGMVLHLAGRYGESVDTFEKAKRLYDSLYTVSISSEASTWFLNDNMAPYRGEDFERVMVNIFQAFNFAMLGNIQEALVEARDVDQKLKLINAQYGPDQKNAYQEDASARLFMGILYENSKDANDLYEAMISYYRALDSYIHDYGRYGVDVPDILKDNALSMAEYLKDPKINDYKDILGKRRPMSFEEKRSKAQIYFIHYVGLSPIKQQIDIPVPVPNGIIAKLAFPFYDERSEEISSGEFKVIGKDHNIYLDEPQTVEDIGSIAIENLNNRKMRVISKAVLRSGLKVTAEHFIKESLRRSYHNDASRYFSYIASLYNIASEQADLRSWQTLPNQIRLCHVIVEPGQYDLYFNNRFLKNVNLKEGDVVFTSYRSTR